MANLSDKIVPDTVVVPLLDFLILEEGELKGHQDLLDKFDAALTALQRTSFVGSSYGIYREAVESKFYDLSESLHHRMRTTGA